MCGCESWTIKKTEHQIIDALKLQCWRSLLRVPWTARRSNQSILKEINPEYPLEGLMLKLKLQYSVHLMWKSWLIRKDSDTGKDLRQEEKGTTKDEMVGWHHQLNGHEFEQALGDGDGQGILVYCSPWGHKESDITEWLNNNNKRKQIIIHIPEKSSVINKKEWKKERKKVLRSETEILDGRTFHV